MTPCIIVTNVLVNDQLGVVLHFDDAEQKPDDDGDRSFDVQ